MTTKPVATFEPRGDKATETAAWDAVKYLRRYSIPASLTWERYTIELHTAPADRVRAAHLLADWSPR